MKYVKQHMHKNSIRLLSVDLKTKYGYNFKYPTEVLVI